MKGKAKMRVLVVDDEIGFLEVTARSLERYGYIALTASSGPRALELAREERPDIILLDVRLPDPRDGIEVLEKIRREVDPWAVIIMMTAYPVIADVVECMSMGAFSYIEKPMFAENFQSMMTKAAREVDKRREHNGGGTSKGTPLDVVWMERSSVLMINVWDRAEKAAAADMNVTIQGRGPVGKERVARMIQEFSMRHGEPFVHVDCRRSAEHLSDRMFFGVEKKTGGRGGGEQGFLEAAGRGVLFLDEIGDLHPEAQKWLVAPLSSGTFCRSGSVEKIFYRARTIVSTTQLLAVLTDRGKFNRDLYPVLGQFTINLPCLTRRKEDIPRIEQGILRNARLRYDKKVEDFSDEVKAFFLRYEWPGEIQEMENVIYRAVSELQGDRITLKHLPPDLLNVFRGGISFDLGGASSKKEKMLMAEKSIVAKALVEAGWDAAKAASELKISRSAIYRVISKFGLK